MVLAVHAAVADDLPGVIDGRGFAKDPAGSGWDHGIQVLHWRPVR